MGERVVRSRFGHFWSFSEVCVVVFVTHVVPFYVPFFDLFIGEFAIFQKYAPSKRYRSFDAL